MEFSRPEFSRLKWVAFPISRVSFQPRDQTQVSCIAGWFFTSWSQEKPKNTGWVACPFSSRSSWPRNQTEVSSIAGRFFTNWAMREASCLWKSTLSDFWWTLKAQLISGKILSHERGLWNSLSLTQDLLKTAFIPWSFTNIFLKKTLYQFEVKAAQ